LYRTGDRARFWSDGNIEFLGRIDHQVKIRGYRIELGEIETALNGHPDIYESVVIATNAGSGDRRLVCYLVLREDKVLSTSEIRNYLLKKLPEYMAPSIYMQLEAMPVTPNGKIDRSALPPPNRDRIEGDNPFVAPRTPHEAKLTEIWSEVLGVEKVGVHDNFFELGGHSLLMIQAVARIRELFNVEIPIQTFFQGPTVADLATAVVQTQASNKNSDEIDYILNLLEQSSHDELESMLAKLSRAN
jgi:acyl carrier protein